MKRTKRQYQDGDVIYRQGEPGEAAFVVVEGSVELERTGTDGARHVKSLRPGQMFGESAIVAPGPREETARAAGAVVVKMLEREDRGRAESQPAAAAPFALLRLALGKLARKERPNAGPAPGSSSRTGALTLVRRLFAAGPVARRATIDVLVAPFLADKDDAATRHIVQSFHGVPHLGVRALPRPLQATEPGREPAERWAAEVDAARRALQERDADAIIVGEVLAEGPMRLAFVAAAEGEESAAPAGPDHPLLLPQEFGLELSPVLHAVALASTARTDPLRAEPPRPAAALAREALPAAIVSAESALQDLPRAMGPRERATLHLALGASAARAAQTCSRPDLHQSAANAFRAAAEQFGRDRSHGPGSTAAALAQAALGGELAAVAERTGDRAIWAEAESALQAALAVLTREKFPREWGAAQNRLGLALYRRGYETGDVDPLKGAIAALQASLQVYGRADAPLRWAETMNSIAQAAQVLGEHLRSEEVLSKAAEACRQALEVRTRDAHPLLWAATQNNLGSALFLLGKATRERSRLEEAVEAFSGAHEIYAARGAERLAAICQKNLARVRRVLEAMTPKPQPRAWFEEEDEAETPANGSGETKPRE